MVNKTVSYPAILFFSLLLYMELYFNMFKRMRQDAWGYACRIFINLAEN